MDESLLFMLICALGIGTATSCSPRHADAALISEASVACAANNGVKDIEVFKLHSAQIYCNNGAQFTSAYRK